MRRMTLCIILCVGAFWMRTNLSRAEEEAVPTRSNRSSHPAASQGSDTNRSTRTSETGGAARIEAKIDQVLANQERILARLDDVMKELQIVKIRATVR